MRFCSLPLAVLLTGFLTIEGAAEESPLSAAQKRLRSLLTVPADWHIPKEADAKNDKLRLLLFAPGGPLLIEAQITADGNPYEKFFEEQIDLVLKVADRDGDGKLNWKTEGTFTRLPGRRLSLEEKDREIWLPALDLDQDGIASRYELRRLLSIAGGAPPLVVGSPQGNPLTAEASFQQVADKDGDRTISADELSQLEQRLKLRDANDDDLINHYELLGAKTDAFRTARKLLSVLSVSIFQLAEETDWALLQKLLEANYGAHGVLGTGEPRLPLLKSLVDGNADGTLDEAELRRLLTAEPQVRVEVNIGESAPKFGDSEPKPGVAALKSVSEALNGVATLTRLPEDKKEKLLKSAQLRLAVRGSSAVARARSFDAVARSYMKRNDQDKNGYLDEKELQGLPSGVDTNGDKKAYPEEIAAFFAGNAGLTGHRIYVTVADEPKGLFTLADADRDGQLSPRELGGVKERLLTLDANQNGQLEPAEIPGLLRLAFTQGSNPNEGGGRMVLLSPRAALLNLSLWYLQMDTNGDGDISPREFLGTPEQFQKLDANHDGFLTTEEAVKGE